MSKESPNFLITKEHRRFVEFCEACQRYQYIGLCYGPPGVGKTLSARAYSRWDDIEYLDSLRFDAFVARPDILGCLTTFYTAPVATSVGRLEKEVDRARATLSCLLEATEYELDGIEHR